MGLVEGKIVDEAEVMEGFGAVFRCVPELHSPAIGDGLVGLFEEESVIAGFNRKMEVTLGDNSNCTPIILIPKPVRSSDRAIWSYMINGHI